MGYFIDTHFRIYGTKIAGALLGNNNTLITTAVMNATNIERSTASAAYSFLRFLGRAIAPFLAGKLSEIFNSHIPFIVGAIFVFLSVIMMLCNYQHIKHVEMQRARIRKTSIKTKAGQISPGLFHVRQLVISASILLDA
jgi:MFS family permease